jgi:hypothetical protein
MAKKQNLNVKALSPETLIEGFVTEAKLSDPAMRTTVAEMNKHVARFYAYADEIAARGGLPSLLPLLDSPDNWIAYRTADRLADLPETKDRAMAVLDRIADECSGSASASAERARNMIRYGDTLGDPVEVEKRLAEIRARDSAR